MFERSKNFSLTVREFIEKTHGKDADNFLHPKKNPEIPQLKEAVQYFKRCAEAHMPVTIIGDYDADGIMASTIMKIGLSRYGVDAKVRIPRRFSEGYGLSEKIIDEIKEGLVITVDNGIAAITAIRKAKEKGLSVIVTDHHLPKKEDGKVSLPPADHIIDPWAYPDAEYAGYCGAGIAYRFIQELLPGQNTDDLKVLAAIATVADVMDITGANWVLVKEGLDILNRGRMVPGLKQIIRYLDVDYFVESDFGFRLGPILNASSRLKDDGAADAFKVMSADYRDFTLPWSAKLLVENNQKRKEITKKCLAEIPFQKERPIVVYDPDWMPGIIGLIAGHLCEEYGCPVIALTDREGSDGVLTGSARSIEGFHIKNLLEKCSKYLLSFGGHAQAAGLSLKKENLAAFEKCFKKACGPVPKGARKKYDIEFNSFTRQMVADLETFAPYGNGNPTPIFHMVYEFKRPVYVGDGSSFADKTEEMDFIAFGLTEKYLRCGKPKKVEMIGNISVKHFHGKTKPQFEIIDFEAAE